MSITLHTTPYGGPATGHLRACVQRAKRASPLAPVTIVVPSNFVGVSVRRDLAAHAVSQGAGGIVGLGILTVYRLGELLGAASLAGQGRRPVSTPVIGSAIRRILADQPGLFGEVAQHPATEAALVRAYRELSDLTPRAVDRLAGASERAAEVVRVARAARDVLRGDWYDEADLLGAATDVAANSTVVRDLGTVLLHLPQRVSPAGAGMVLALAERTDVQVVAGLTGHADADAEVVATLRRLGLDVPDAPPQSVGATSIVTVSDAEEEARTAVAEVVDAARRGIPLERIGILYPAPEPYARIVADHLDAAGIPWNGRAVRPLADRLAGRWLLDLLSLADSRWSRPQVLGLFGAAPGRGARHQAGKAAEWERISREAGIVDGRDDWGARLGAWADNADARARAEAAREEPTEWRIERHRREATAARDLAEYVDVLASQLDVAAELATWSELSAWAHDVLASHLGAEHERARWPDLEQSAAQKVEAALDRLGALDQIEPQTDLTTFTRSLALELEDDLGRKGRFGEGVLVGTLAAGLGVDLDVVTVLGMAEGVLPTRPREDSLIADADRELVADQLPPRTARVGAEHRRLLAAVAGADRRVLVFPRGDLRRSVERAPSRWLRDAVQEATGSRDLGSARGLVTHVPSYAGRVATTAFAADEQELLLSRAHRHLAGQRLDPDVAADLDGVLGDGVTVLDGRGQGRFTRFNGNLAAVADHVAAHHDAPHQLSASRVEAWLACPHGYLVKHLLRVDPVENPEEQLAISPLDRGLLFHDVAERWLDEHLRAGTVPGPATPWSGDARARLLELAEEALDRIAAEGVVGHPLLWRQERRVLQGEFVEFLVQDDLLRREGGLTPIGVEVAFGLDGTPPLVVDLGDGRELRFAGKIDRLDRTASGGLVVTDYKTGSSRRYRDLSQDDPAAGASRVQLMLYALAARQHLDRPDAPVHARYWFTSSKGEWETIGYDVTPEVEARLHDLLRDVDRHIRAGVFPQRPAEPGWRIWVDCHYCDPDGLGTGVRHREFERLARSPELADWLALVDPELAAEVAP